jgi:isopenicillin N synthase-like dioxygenase
MTVANNFTSIPILNYGLLSSPNTRAIFIKQLQHALINVGFLYLEHPPVSDALIDDVIAYLPRVFALSQEHKDALCMANSPHFLGYSRLGVERTKGAADQREQFDIATPFECVWKPGEPEYLRHWGPSQVRFVFFLMMDRGPPPPGLGRVGRGAITRTLWCLSSNAICVTDMMIDDGRPR